MWSIRNVNFSAAISALPITMWLLTRLASNDIIARFGLSRDSVRRWDLSLLLHTFFHTDTYGLVFNILQHLVSFNGRASCAPDIVGGLIGTVLGSIVFVRTVPSYMWEARSSFLQPETASQVWTLLSAARIASEFRSIFRFALMFCALPLRPACAFIPRVRCGAELSGVSVVLCGGASLNSAIRGFRNAYQGRCNDLSRHGALFGIAVFCEDNESQLAALLPVFSYAGGAVVGFAVRMWEDPLALLPQPPPLEIPAELLEKAAPGESGIKVLVRHRGEDAYANLIVPASCFCPITHEIMNDPVRTYDGFTFEREAITTWMKGSDMCPLTNLPLPSKRLKPNFQVRRAIVELVQQYRQLLKGQMSNARELENDESELYYEYVNLERSH